MLLCTQAISHCTQNIQRLNCNTISTIWVWSYYLKYTATDSGDDVFAAFPPFTNSFIVSISLLWLTVISYTCGQTLLIMLIYIQMFKQSGLPKLPRVKMASHVGTTHLSWRSLLPSYHDTQQVDSLAFGRLIDFTSSKLPYPTMINHAEDQLSNWIIKSFQETYSAPPYQRFDCSEAYQRIKAIHRLTRPTQRHPLVYSVCRIL